MTLVQELVIDVVLVFTFFYALMQFLPALLPLGRLELHALIALLLAFTADAFLKRPILRAMAARV